MKKHSWWIIVLALLAFGLVGCAQTEQAGPQGWSSIQAGRLEKTSAGEDLFFGIEVDEEMLDKQTPITVAINCKVESGRLGFILRDPQGNKVWDSGTTSDSLVNQSVYQPTQAGMYHLGPVWDAGTNASYDLSWRVFSVSPMVVFPGVGMVVVAMAFTVYALAHRAGWRWWWFGALCWMVTVAVKFAIAIPINQSVYALLYQPGQLWAPGSIAFYLYVGLLTGVTEVLMTWLLLRYTRFGQAGWARALTFAVGFGAFEALMLGLSSFLTSAAALVAPETVGGAIGSMQLMNNPLFGLAPIVERLGTIFVHMACCLLLFYGAQRREWRWFWYSFALKSLLDAVAGFAQMWGVTTLANMWIMESLVIVFGVVSYWIVRWLADRWPAPAEAPAGAAPLQPVEQE